MTATNPQNERMTDQNREQTRDAGPQTDQHQDARERHLDKTIADSFPASDPPSSDPNPDGDE
jgi:hypothetical protein